MKIVHICVTGPYNDGWQYQENLITKYQSLKGHRVSIMVSRQMYDKNGKIIKTCEGTHVNRDGVRVIRLDEKKGALSRRLVKYRAFYRTLCEEKPDIIFMHGINFTDVSNVKKYIKINSGVLVYADNHADFSNSATNWLSKNILHKIIWRHYAQMICPYVKKFYGVLPARVDFLVNVYGLPREKCKLLVMGADDELAEKYSREESREWLCKKLGFAPDDFVIITGGKIDRWKKQTLLLMQAVRKMKDRKIKLVIFGSVAEELKQKFSRLTDNKKIFYIGWIGAEESYRYFAAADLAVFPGRHSVFWEQAAGQGIPMVCRDWEGTHHIDAGGSVKFINADSVEEIKDIIAVITGCQEVYSAMKKAAVEKGMKVFSYRDIAGRCIED